MQQWLDKKRVPVPFKRPVGKLRSSPLYGAPAVRCEGNQSNRTTARAEGQSYPGGMGGGGEERKRGSQTNLCRRQKERRKTALASLKLRWITIGWLPSFPLPVTDTDSRFIHFLYDNIYIALTAGAKVIFPIQQLNRNKEGEQNHHLERCVSLLANGHTAGRGRAL